MNQARRILWWYVLVLECVIAARAFTGGGGLLVPSGPRTGIIVYEANESTPEFAALQTALRRSDYFKQHNHDLLIVDKDARDKNNNPSPLVTKYEPDWKSSQLPVLLVCGPGGGVIVKGELSITKNKPAEAQQQVIDLFKKGGGG